MPRKLVVWDQAPLRDYIEARTKGGETFTEVARELGIRRATLNDLCYRYDKIEIGTYSRVIKALPRLGYKPVDKLGQDDFCAIKNPEPRSVIADDACRAYLERVLSIKGNFLIKVARRIGVDGRVLRAIRREGKILPESVQRVNEGLRKHYPRYSQAGEAPVAPVEGGAVGTSALIEYLSGKLSQALAPAAGSAEQREAISGLFYGLINNIVAYRGAGGDMDALRRTMDDKDLGFVSGFLSNLGADPKSLDFYYKDGYAPKGRPKNG